MEEKTLYCDRRTLIVTESTNDYIRHVPVPPGCDILLVTTEYQTAGRGQGTNKWESEKGKNLLFSIKLKPENIWIGDQFILTMATSIALCETFIYTFHDEGFTIKWPNDIYYHDKKVSGTLSECSIRKGFVNEYIAGIGINVNQLFFRGDAPNPISLSFIAGHEIDREELLDDIMDRFCQYVEYVNRKKYEYLRRIYNNSLYRKDGIYEYEDKYGRFKAKLSRIMPNGHLELQRIDGTLSEYEFKQVKFIL